jgi:hypothetical protein
VIISAFFVKIHQIIATNANYLIIFTLINALKNALMDFIKILQKLNALIAILTAKLALDPTMEIA